jgi:hypothetical protein
MTALHVKRFFSFLLHGAINAAGQLLQSTSLILVSLVIVPTHGIEFWGEFVTTLLFPTLAVHIISWGNTAYLLQRFSLQPQNINTTWTENFSTRFFLFCAISLLFITVPIQESLKFAILFWAAGNFVYQPFLVLIIFNRKFAFSLLLELLTLLPLLIYIHQFHQTIEELVLVTAVPFYIKTIAAFIFFRGTVFAKIKKFWNPSLLYEAFPFFTLSVLGILSSRIGLYIAAFLLPASELGFYQLINSFFSIIQVMAFFFLQPFIKNAYRLKDLKIKFIARQMFIFGALVLLIGAIVVAAVMKFYFKLDVSLAFLIAGYLMALPYYYYAIYMNRVSTDNQGELIKISLLSTLGSAILGVVCIEIAGTLGALVASAIVQWAVLIYFYFRGK